MNYDVSTCHCIVAHKNAKKHGVTPAPFTVVKNVTSAIMCALLESMLGS